jgi:hypothetical protein
VLVEVFILGDCDARQFFVTKNVGDRVCAVSITAIEVNHFIATPNRVATQNAYFNKSTSTWINTVIDIRTNTIGPQHVSIKFSNLVISSPPVFRSVLVYARYRTAVNRLVLR